MLTQAQIDYIIAQVNAAGAAATFPFTFDSIVDFTGPHNNRRLGVRIKDSSGAIQNETVNGVHGWLTDTTAFDQTVANLCAAAVKDYGS